MVSGAIERATGLETIPHVTTRDCDDPRPRVDAARRARRGRPQHPRRSPATRPRSATTRARAASTSSTRSASRASSRGLNHGEDFNGRPIDAPTSFFVGVAVNPTADDLELEAERFHQKLEAGAKFAMTQIVFDIDALDRFAERIGGCSPIPVLAGIFPL